MYTGKHARPRPLQRAFIMAASGEHGPIASWRGAATGSHICFAGEGLDHYGQIFETPLRPGNCVICRPTNDANSIESERGPDVLRQASGTITR
jgi:hypothetical protein